jgi:hypothetical protein
MKIYTFIDKGGLYARGAVEVAGYQPSSLSLTAPVTIGVRATDKGSWFVVTTAAATDNIVLAADIPAGVGLVVAPSLGCEIAVETGGSANGGTDAQVVDIASGSRAEIMSLGGGDFTVEQVTAAGARTAPSPAADG